MDGSLDPAHPPNDVNHLEEAMTAMKYASTEMSFEFNTTSSPEDGEA